MDVREQLVKVAQDEKDVIMASFSNRDAWELGCLMVNMAKEREISLTISIDINGQRVFWYAFDGTHLNNESAVIRKSRVAHVFRCCSMRVWLELQQTGTKISDRGRDPMDYLAMGGAVPIRLKDSGVIGTVCVSGLAHPDDHQFVIDAMKAFINR